jgi:hypothetical protein
MFNQLTAKESRAHKMNEGFGVEMDIAEVRRIISRSAPQQLVIPASGTIPTINGTVTSSVVPAPLTFNGIASGQMQTALLKPLSGRFNQNKYIPLIYCGPNIIELELVNHSTDPIATPSVAPAAALSPER